MAPSKPSPSAQDVRRWPGRVYGSGHEPDPRFTLANERTFLAWTRTALALIAAGVSLAAFVEDFPRGLREAVAIVLILTGVATALSAFTRWMRTEAALRHDRPLPGPGLAPVLTAGLTVVAVVLAVLVVLRG